MVFCILIYHYQRMILPPLPHNCFPPSHPPKESPIFAKSVGPFFFITIKWSTPNRWNCNATSV